MPRKRTNETRDAEVLAPVPVQVLDQFVREGPLTAAEIEAATRRFKKSHHRTGPWRGAEPPSRVRPRRCEAGRRHQSSQRHERQDGPHR